MNNGGFNYRQPPYWAPEQNQSYSFRAYVTDLTLWCMFTELQPHQQAVAIITRLGGVAGEMARLLHPHEIANGGVINGQQLDLVTYLVSKLATG